MAGGSEGADVEGVVWVKSEDTCQCGGVAHYGVKGVSLAVHEYGAGCVNEYSIGSRRVRKNVLIMKAWTSTKPTCTGGTSG